MGAGSWSVGCVVTSPSYTRAVLSSPRPPPGSRLPRTPHPLCITRHGHHAPRTSHTTDITPTPKSHHRSAKKGADLGAGERSRAIGGGLGEGREELRTRVEEPKQGTHPHNEATLTPVATPAIVRIVTHPRPDSRSREPQRTKRVFDRKLSAA